MSTGVLRFNDAADISIYFSDQSLLDELINLTEKYFWNYFVSFSYFICNTNYSKKEKHVRTTLKMVIYIKELYYDLLIHKNIKLILVNQSNVFDLNNMTAEYIELSDWSEYDVDSKKLY